MTRNGTSDIKVRRIAFSYPEGAMNHLYADGDLILSHLVAVLSALFPEGEDFFIRAVRHYSDQITDPDLKEAVKGFIGQEVTHSREHRDLNDRLQEMGYPTRTVDKFTKWLLKDVPEKRFVPVSPLFNLAVTAGLEHYTASLAEMLLTSSEARDLLGNTEVRNTLLWHALEESEHKAVSFDVYRAVGGTEKMRTRTFTLVSALFIIILVSATAASMAQDRASYSPVRLVRSVKRVWNSPLLTRELLRTIRTYLHKGFHPNDFDSSNLIAEWREELFGEGGELISNLR